MTISEMGAMQSDGTVDAVISGWVEKRLDGGLMRVVAGSYARVCRKAVSCLLEPAIGDRVALHDAGDGITYVLAVLERPGSEPARLRLDRPVSVEMTADFELSVGGMTHLHCGDELKLDAGQAVLNLGAMDMVASTMHALIGEVGLHAGSLRLVCKAIDTIADRLVQVMGHSCRSVEGTDQLQAGQIDHVALQQLRLHARNALFTADQLAKIDAAQIHLG